MIRNLIEFSKIKGKKGMETWFLVFLIIAIVILIAFLVWYSTLGDHTDNLFGNIIDWF